jgi:hypothetical protein
MPLASIVGKDAAERQECACRVLTLCRCGPPKASCRAISTVSQTSVFLQQQPMAHCAAPPPQFLRTAAPSPATESQQASVEPPHLKPHPAENHQCQAYV